MNMNSLLRNMRRCRRLVARFGRDKRGIGAVEFAFIAPVMMMFTFGTIDVSSGVAIDRKVTLVARTLSDLVSQGTKVSTTDISNFFQMGGAVMTPYPVTSQTMKQSITAISIDATKKMKVVWSYSGVVNGATVTIKKEDETKVIPNVPTGLVVANTQLIWSSVTYTYTPIVGYITKTPIPLTDECYTRPRQSNEVLGPTS